MQILSKIHITLTPDEVTALAASRAHVLRRKYQQAAMNQLVTLVESLLSTLNRLVDQIDDTSNTLIAQLPNIYRDGLAVFIAKFVTSIYSIARVGKKLVVLKEETDAARRFMSDFSGLVNRVREETKVSVDGWIRDSEIVGIKRDSERLRIDVEKSLKRVGGL